MLVHRSADVLKIGTRRLDLLNQFLRGEHACSRGIPGSVGQTRAKLGDYRAEGGNLLFELFISIFHTNLLHGAIVVSRKERVSPRSVNLRYIAEIPDSGACFFRLLSILEIGLTDRAQLQTALL